MPSKPDAINRSFALAAIVQIKYVHNLISVMTFRNQRNLSFRLTLERGTNRIWFTMKTYAFATIVLSEYDQNKGFF